MWSYSREEQKFEVLPEGKYRARIKSAEKAVSKNGKDMLVLQFNISGSEKVLYHYIVFLEDRPEITNRNLTQFFDSFSGIKEGDLNTANWVGKIGAVNIKHEEYEGQIRERISSFIPASKQDELPQWITATADTNSNNMDFGEDDIPF